MKKRDLLIPFMTLFLWALSFYSCNESMQESQIELTNSEIIKRAEGDSCFSDGFVEFSACSHLSKTINVTFDEYPDCTFGIRFGYVKCSNQFSGGKVIYLQDVELVSHDCEDYDNDVLLAQQNGTLAEFSLHFDKMLFDAASHNLGQAAHSFAAVVIKYKTASCMQYCYILGTKGSYEYYTFVRTRCGEGCCAIEREYIEHPDGTLIWSTVDNTEYYDLDECNIDIVSCHPNAIFSSECTFRCDSFL